MRLEVITNLQSEVASLKAERLVLLDAAKAGLDALQTCSCVPDGYNATFDADKVNDAITQLQLALKE